MLQVATSVRMTSTALAVGMLAAVLLLPAAATAQDLNCSDFRRQLKRQASDGGLAAAPNNLDGRQRWHCMRGRFRQAAHPQATVISLRQASMPGSWSLWGLAVWAWREAWHGGHDGSRTRHPNKSELGEAFGEAL